MMKNKTRKRISQKAFATKVMHQADYVAGKRQDPEDFSNLDMSGLTVPAWQGVTLAGAKFDDSVIDGINAVGVNFTGCTFRNASLRKANLVSAVLDGCDFEGADLARANLSYASMRGTKGAVLDEAYTLPGCSEMPNGPVGPGAPAWSSGASKASGSGVRPADSQRACQEQTPVPEPLSGSASVRG